MGRMSLMGLIVLVAGCSKGVEDPVAPGGNETEQGLKAIAFSAGLPEQQEITRSTPLEEELPVGQKTFKVWGYKNDAYDSGSGSYTSYQTVFPGYNVNWAANTAATTTSNTHDWEYVGVSNSSVAQTIKYWDWSAKAYRYFAVTNYEETKPATLVAGKIYNESFGTDEYQFTMLADVTDIAAAPFFSRMWFSTGNAVTYPDKQFGDPVVLEFTKPFARVRIIFIFSEDGINRTNIAQMSFKPVSGAKIPQSGTVTVHYPLTGVKTSEYYSLADGYSGLDEFTRDWYECSDPNDPNYANREYWYTVLPSGDQGAYEMTIKIFGEFKTAFVPADFMQWKAGYEYTYLFKVTDAGGVTLDVIQVGINDWVIKNANNHTVYNW